MSTTEKLTYRPRLVFAYVDSAHAAQCSRFLRRQGWEVHLVTSAEQVHQLVQELNPQVVVLDLDLPDESGWLAAAKILLKNADRRFILTCQQVTDQNRDWAADLGTAIIAREDGPAALAQEIQSHLAQAV